MAEKHNVSQVEDARREPAVEKGPEDVHVSRNPDDIDKKAERRLLFKLDIAILPMTVLMASHHLLYSFRRMRGADTEQYLSANLDRGNIGNARLQGLQATLLGGSDTKYSVVLLCFYITYMLCSIPGTLLSKAVPPNYALGAGCLIWGVAATCMAGCQSFGAIIVCRLFIGIGEAIFGQAVVLHYSLWYKKNEIATRLAAFIGAGVLAGAFGGLIAYGVSHIKGSLATWRILFLIEGCPSVVLGLLVVLFLPSRPDRSKYLTESERELEFLRLRSQNLDEGDHGIDWNGVKRAFTDWKTYVVTFIYSCMQLTLSSLSGFFPTIIKSLGYTNADAQLYTVPPYAVGFVFMIGVNMISDRVRMRGPFIMLVFAINVLGWVLLLTVVNNEHLRYFATFCIVIGGYCTIPLIQSWVSNNTGSQSQRAVHLGMLNSLANWAALVSPFIFPTEQAPRWPLGFGLNLGFSCIAIVVTLAMLLYYKRENARRDEMEGGRPSRDQKIDVVRLHDLAPGFRYTM